jgi:hypothetical protein
VCLGLKADSRLLKQNELHEMITYELSTATGCHTLRLRPFGFASPDFSGFAISLFNFVSDYSRRAFLGEKKPLGVFPNGRNVWL